MRSIKPEELQLIRYLSQVANIDVPVQKGQQVWVVNTEMGSIRSKECSETTRVYSVASCEFDDLDGTPVVVSLLLADGNRFGELDFWKVTDEPIACHSVQVDVLRNLIAIKDGKTYPVDQQAFASTRAK